MSTNRILFTLSVLVVFGCASACGGGQPGNSESSTEPTAEVQAPPAGAGENHDETTYEPAYPDDVSSEGLTDSDTGQQEASHSHSDGDEHTHEDGGTHSHDEGDEHSHDEGDEHSHDEGDEHSH